MLLKDQSVPPTDETIENGLRETYPVYKEFIGLISGPDFGLVPEWNYYKDGKAWLCKVVYKKKTVFWLSVWGNCFKIVFYFTEKHCQGISDLVIDNKIKDDFINHKPIGKLLPLIIYIAKKEQIEDAVKVIRFKKALK